MNADTALRAGRKQLPNDRRRWLALFVLCLRDLMIVLDTTEYDPKEAPMQAPD